MDVQTVHERDDDGIQHTYRVVSIRSGGGSFPHTFEVSDDGDHAGHDYLGSGRPGDLEARDEPPESAVNKLAAAFGDEA